MSFNSKAAQNRSLSQPLPKKNKSQSSLKQKKLFMVVNCRIESLIPYNISATTTILVHAINTLRGCDYSNNNEHCISKRSIHHPSLPISTTQSCRNIATFHPQSFFSNFITTTGLFKPNNTQTRIRSEPLF